jgi:hypothetical protein
MPPGVITPTRTMDPAILVALIGSLTTIVVALIQRSRDRRPQEPSLGKSPAVQQTRQAPRSRFFLILLLGLSITANAVLFALVKPWSVPTVLESTPAPTTQSQPTVKSSDGTVEITCPPGTYMNGITFRIDKGGPHGIISNITPKYQPLPTSAAR